MYTLFSLSQINFSKYAILSEFSFLALFQNRQSSLLKLVWNAYFHANYFCP
jgi:hypothetical protein